MNRTDRIQLIALVVVGVLQLVGFAASSWKQEKIHRAFEEQVRILKLFHAEEARRQQSIRVLFSHTAPSALRRGPTCWLKWRAER